MNTEVLTPQDLLKLDFEQARKVSEAFRLEQHFRNMEKAGISFGMFVRRFTREAPKSVFAWMNSGPALLAAFEISNNTSLISTSLNALRQAAQYFTRKEAVAENTTVDGLAVASVPVSLAVFNELQMYEKNLNARLLELQKQNAPDLKSNPHVLFEAQQNQMHDTAFGYGIRIMPDSSIAHCSNKVALLSKEFGPCTSWSRLTGQPHEIISVFDSSAAPRQLVTRFEPKAQQASLEFAPAYA